MRTNIEDKIVTVDFIHKISQHFNKIMVLTNGCFDILHYGHFKLFQKARSLGDFLIVAINSDSSIRQIKGNFRPINNQLVRAFNLSCIEFIDFVIIFDELTPESILSQIRPNILVKGGDYNPDTVLGKEFVDRVVLVDFEPGFSTSDIIKRLKYEESI